MVEQPAGTVTLVFSDIEGSTRLLREFGERRYREVLREHRRLVRAALASRGGYEVDCEGDSFFYAFGSAGDAVAAVSESMRALEPTPVRIRVGVHTGRPALDPPKYVGLDVHLAARVMAAGHGGQVLLTAATRELVDGAVRELGEHRLKDFDAPVALFQLGERPFPPLRTIANTNLPRPASSFVGREREVGELVSLLRDGARLVTLVGPGGSGKTRLAIEAAAELVGEFRAGVFWVGLAGLREPSLVLPAVGQTLGASGGLADHIEGRELLLVLDNFEQVVESAPELARLVEACPNLRLLLTSRELLRVRGEVHYQVPPLARSDAVDLFCARSQRSRSDAIRELCLRLDDLPLALELAAARSRILSPEQILERLSRRLDLFRGGRDADPRQQSLRATIDWSHSLLTPAEQRLFARLGVFAGGCTLESAEAVCEAELDTLQSLVEKSLLRHSDGRFWMLETIREYAQERLEASGEAEALCRGHAEFLLRFVEAAGFAHEATGGERHDLVRAERANLRTALAWASEADAELGIRLVCRLEMFWAGCDPQEGRRWLGLLLDRAGEIPDPLRALALKCYGGFVWLDGNYEDGYRHYEHALELYRRLGDEWGIRLMQPRIAAHLALRSAAPDLVRARALCEQSLVAFRRAGFAKGEAEALLILAYVEHAESDYERALASSLRSELLAEQVGWTWWRVGCLNSAAECALRLNRRATAAGYARRSLLLAQEIGGRQWITAGLMVLAAAAADGDPERAGRLFGAIEAEAERGRLGQWEGSERDELARELAAVAGPEFELAVVEGRALTLDQAVSFALEELDGGDAASAPAAAGEGSTAP